MMGKKLPKFKPDKNLKRGEYEWFTSNTGLVAVKWRGKRWIHLLSNYHNPALTTEVKRKQKEETSVQVPCPLLLTDYNKNMNFVNKFDQMRACYGIDKKSHKWWHRIFYFFINAAVVNAVIIYKLHQSSSPKLTKKS
ncbi:hypothetical protein NQ314_009925 [Rhamnusium bicolor]|uniref:PiggyBac transposable element-derived protein domain-containing protein n=1 Tax=Rhamnusium bicolor TaxID=1586634 RepID=A0AAV8XWM1_9CUCU|nr:hypothetical protein NQ314_009925 [Rhamnusium bicolor]